MADIQLMLGDCLDRMREIPDASVDAIITDPPYPEIDRPYGRMTEAAWHAMMRGVVAGSRRVLKPSGSAMFILQPNSERVGRMRPWLWEFMAWVGKEWGIVQDAYWWNFATLPMTKKDPEAMRGSIKNCVWTGPVDCYRNASAVRWSESDANRAIRESGRCTNKLHVRPSGASVRDKRTRSASVANGGVTPFNLLPIGPDGKDGMNPHPGRTPLLLAEWWVRYISPEGGTVCDPFMGSGTTGLAALKRGRKFVGIERDAGYFATAERRIAAHRAATPLFAETM